MKTLAARLNALFESTGSSKDRYSNNEAAAAIKAANPSVRVGGAYLSALRSGKRVRPSVELLVALANFFGVSVSYFTDPDPHSRDSVAAAREAELSDQLNELGIRRIAMRAVGLDEDSLSTVSAVLDHVRKLQGLPTIGGDTDDEIVGEIAASTRRGPAPR